MRKSATTPETELDDARAAWETKAKNLLRGELRRRGITYKMLAVMLREVGLQESDRNISNKIGRGSFTAVFLLQCLHVIGANQILLTD